MLLLFSGAVEISPVEKRIDIYRFSRRPLELTKRRINHWIQTNAASPCLLFTFDSRLRSFVLLAGCDNQAEQHAKQGPPAPRITAYFICFHSASTFSVDFSLDGGFHLRECQPLSRRSLHSCACSQIISYGEASAVRVSLFGSKASAVRVFEIRASMMHVSTCEIMLWVPTRP